MAGWTDVVFRTICKRMGAGLTYTEMVSAQGLEHGSAKTEEYLAVSEEEGQVAVQLFGNDPGVMAHQAALLNQEMGGKLAAIDINMGCPARKVVRKGEGSALMKTPELAARIVESMAGASSAPITVKFRRGYARGDDTAVEFAKAMEAAGAAAVCVHGRYAADMYHGHADWDVIRRVREAVSIPTIASGDLMSARAVSECFDATGADAVMIARGAQGNPWIFAQTAELLRLRAEGEADGRDGGDASTWQPAPISLEERLRIARMHTRMLAERDRRTVVHMRNYFMPYFKGIPGASFLRGQVVKCATLSDFERFFDYIWEQAVEHGYATGEPGGGEQL